MPTCIYRRADRANLYLGVDHVVPGVFGQIAFTVDCACPQRPLPASLYATALLATNLRECNATTKFFEGPSGQRAQKVGKVSSEQGTAGRCKWYQIRGQSEMLTRS
jgi:hypothetical protein